MIGWLIQMIRSPLLDMFFSLLTLQKTVALSSIEAEYTYGNVGHNMTNFLCQIASWQDYFSILKVPLYYNNQEVSNESCSRIAFKAYWNQVPLYLRMCGRWG